MKYMVEYSTRPGSTVQETLQNYETLLGAFAKWAPPAGLTIHAFVHKVEAAGGYILVELDDPAILHHWVIQFLSWNDARVIPVVDVEETVPIHTPALAWTRSATEG